MRRKWLLLLLLGGMSPSVIHAQTLNIFAAASLKESASEIARQFERRHPNITVNLNFGGTQQLVAQIREGAPVDILMSAGFEPLKSLHYDKSSLLLFATNKLALVVPSGSKRVQSFQDLATGIRLIVAAPRVPVGRYTDEMLLKAQRELGSAWVGKVNQGIVSREQDVRAVLAKVSLGEADAGVVYVTDVSTAKGKVRSIPIPSKYNVQAQYPAVRFNDSANASFTRGFLKFLLEADAQKTLKSHGFGPPNTPIDHKPKTR